MRLYKTINAEDTIFSITYIDEKYPHTVQALAFSGSTELCQFFDSILSIYNSTDKKYSYSMLTGAGNSQINWVGTCVNITTKDPFGYTHYLSAKSETVKKLRAAL